VNREELRAALHAFVTPSTARGIVSVGTDLAMYAGAVILAMLVEPPWARLALGIVAGMLTAGLFVLGHDAAHNSLTPDARLNALLAAVCMLPALHNPTLWRVEHHRKHHLATNVKGLNSWSPLSHAEYRALPRWRQAVERVYRSGLGFGPYYLVERWWKAKLYPRGLWQLPAALRTAALRDCVIIVAWLLVFLVGIVLLARQNADPSPWLAVLYGFVVPYTVWSTMMGYTVWFQHTHPDVPWFRTREEAEAFGGQEQATIHIVHARPWGFLTHEIMEHNAHHAHPLIPHYRLRAAQARLNELTQPRVVTARLTPRYVLDLARRCKLYDYDRHRWLDFAGQPTAEPATGRAAPFSSAG